MHWFKESTSHLIYDTKFKALLVLWDGRVLLAEVWVISHDGLWSDRLLPLSDGRHFPDGPGGTGLDAPGPDGTGVPLPFRRPVDGHRAHSVDGVDVIAAIASSVPCRQVAFWRLRARREIRIGHVVVIIFLAAALHKEPRAFHKLVNWHGGAIWCCFMALNTGYLYVLTRSWLICGLE